MNNMFVPGEGKVLFFFGQDRDSIEEYTSSFRRIPAGFTVYSSVKLADGLESAADNGGIQDGQSIVDRYPDSAIHVGLSAVGSLEEIVAGKLDANIDRIGRWIVRADRPVFLRIGYEFDFPQNRYEPLKYISAYRYIADRFRKNSVVNIAYVWHSYAGAADLPIMDWYPGDDFVDWCAVSYFANPTSFMDGMAEFAGARGKPYMIAEATPYGTGNKSGQELWDLWYKGVMEYIRSRNVKAFCYIGCDWEKIPMFAGQGWGDARVQNDPVIRKNWEKVTERQDFLHASKDLFHSLGYRKAK